MSEEAILSKRLQTESTNAVNERLTLSNLLEEIRNLQQQLTMLSQQVNKGQILTVTTDKEQLYLGQSTLIKATLRDKATGKIVVGQPITLFSHWGELRSLNQQDSQKGSSITVFTGSDGVARALLSPLTAEVLSPDQYDALISALAKLPVDASSPQHVLGILQDLGRDYHSNTSFMLRRAIDIYLQAFHPNLKDTINSYNTLANWQQQQVAIMALAQGGTTATNNPLGQVQGDSSVQVSAVCNVTIIDWLPAWLEAFIQFKENESTLSENFSYVSQLEGGQYSLVKTFNYYINDFVVQQRGLAGEYAGKRIIDKSVNTFIENNISESDLELTLSVDTQSTLFTNLSSISKNLAVNGLRGLRSAEQARLVLDQDISKEYTNKGSFNKLQADVGNTDSRFNRFQQDVGSRLNKTVTLSVFNKFETSIKKESSSNKLQLSTLNSKLKASDLLLNTLDKKVDKRIGTTVTRSDLTKLQNNLESLLAKKSDLTDLNKSNSAMRELAAKVDSGFEGTVSHDDLKQTTKTLQRAISKKASVASLTSMNSSLRRVIAQNRTVVNTQLNKTRTEMGALIVKVDKGFARTATRTDLNVMNANLRKSLNKKANLEELSKIDENLQLEITRNNSEVNERLNSEMVTMNKNIKRSRFINIRRRR